MKSVPSMLAVFVILASASLLRLPTTFAADARPYPGHQCMGDCTPSEIEIWNHFEAAGNLDPQVAGRLYSGDCHVKGENYDGEDTHHGVAYFSIKDSASNSPPADRLADRLANRLASHSDELHFEGRFTFFGNGNPYAHWSIADAIRELQPKNDPLSLITFDESFAWVDFHPDQIPMMQYYFREERSLDTIYLVGIWGEKHTLFCAFTPNRNSALPTP